MTIKKQKTQREGERAPGLSAGYAEACITNGLDLVDQDFKAEDWNIQDDLWVRALAIKSNRSACKVIITCDLHGLDYRFCQTVRDLVNEEVPRAEIVLVCSSTRYGLPLEMLRQFGDVKNILREWLLDIISQTALSALALLSPVVFRSVVLKIADPEGSDNHPVSARVLQIADRLYYKPLATIVQMDYYPWTDLMADKLISADFAGYFFREMVAQNAGALLFLPGIHLEKTKYDHFEATGKRCTDLVTVINRRIHKAEWQVDPKLIFASAWSKTQVRDKNQGDEILYNRASFIRIGEIYLAALPLICTPDLAVTFAEICPDCAMISQVDGDLENEISIQSGEEWKAIQKIATSDILSTIQELIAKQLAY